MNLEDLKTHCEKCNKCNLAKTRNAVVFGEGSKNAKIMFIGEGPGKKEDMSGKMFVGEAGILLDKMLKAIDLQRNEIYLTNVIKCHPPKNRDPNISEREACLDYLRAQVSIIKPTIIVCLGRIAAITLIDPNFKITKQHGAWIKRGNYWLIATYHPAALLYDSSKKEASWSDLKIIKKKLDEINIIS